MRSGKYISIGLAVVFITASISFASVIIWREGKWPGPWPKQLKAYRQQTRTVDISGDIEETVFEISFENRDKFEKAWPEIIKLKSEGAPLILEKGPSKYKSGGTTIDKGIRILWLSTQKIIMDDGTELRDNPAELALVRTETGELPEYAIEKDGQWIPYTSQDNPGPRHRTRVDIVLITDANIVDLNRIPLPAETSIIDRRFSKKQP
jgi:hypothetical protein